MTSKSIMEQFMEDAEIDDLTNDELSAISNLAQEQKRIELEIQSLEVDLLHAKEALRQVQEFLLPEAMAKVGMSEFKLVDGSKITIKDDVYASIRKDKVSEAVSWLDSIGLGDIVKDKIDVNFGRGESRNAAELMAFCRSNGYSASETLSVHPQTLKATVKEQMSRGIEFPDDLFSTGPIRKAIIKSK